MAPHGGFIQRVIHWNIHFLVLLAVSHTISGKMKAVEHGGGSMMVRSCFVAPNKPRIFTFYPKTPFRQVQNSHGNGVDEQDVGKV